MMVRHLLDTPPPMRSVRPDVTAGLEAVVGKAMARDPAERFATAAEYAAALGMLEAGADPGVAARAQDRPAVHRRAPVHQPEPRSGQRIFQ